MKPIANDWWIRNTGSPLTDRQIEDLMNFKYEGNVRELVNLLERALVLEETDFKLPAKFVIHTVGPVYYGGEKGEPEKLANCYRNSLVLAADNNLKSIAFPCISTGVYGYPIEAAAEIAMRGAVRLARNTPAASIG